MKRLALVLSLLATTAQSQTITWMKLDPGAIRTTRTADVALELLSSGPVSSIRLDFAGSGTMTLTQSAPGRWTASIPAARALADYQQDDVNHNFVGFLRLLGGGGETLVSYNAFIEVIDDRVPVVPVRNLSGDARATTRILNLFRPGIGINDVRQAAQQFYGYFPDEFDFLQVVYANPSYPSNRYHFAVRNDVDGTGLQEFNNATMYGSAGKLQGINVFPLASFFDTADTTFSHELGHQWINFLDNPTLMPGPHWPPSTMARGIMGFNIAGSNVGGEFSFEVTAVTSTTARLSSGSATQEYSDFDLYLMGFIPPSAVSPGIVVQGTPCNGCVLPSTTITIADVIAVNGARSPDSTSAQKSFRLATIVVTRDRLLTDDEMAMFEYFAARGESKTSLPYTAGFSRGTTKPFYVATRTLGRVDFRLEHPPRRRGARR